MKSELPSIRCQTCASRKKSVFCDLGEEHFKELDEAKVFNHYKPKQFIFYGGNQPCGVYCVFSGKVKIFKTDPEGHQQIVRLAGPGDILGYRSLLACEPYAASAEALEEVSACFLDRRTFYHILETHPVTTFRILSSLAQELGKAELQVINLAHKNVRERFAELLLILKKKYGEKSSKGIRLKIALTREELAELIGTTQESVIRLITEFKNDGLVAVERRDIVLLDIPKLVKTANLPE